MRPCPGRSLRLSAPGQPAVDKKRGSWEAVGDSLGSAPAGQARSSLSLCAPALSHQAPSRFRASWTPGAGLRPTPGGLCQLMPSSAEQAPGTPQAPSPCGSTRSWLWLDLWSPRGAATVPTSLIACGDSMADASCWGARTELLHGRTGQGSTQNHELTISPAFKGDRKQRKRKNKLINSKTSFLKRRSQNEARQSRLRNLHFKMPSDPLSYIPRKDCNTAALGQPFGQARASGVSHSPGRRLPRLDAGQACTWVVGKRGLPFPRLCPLSSHLQTSPQIQTGALERGQELYLLNILFHPRQILQNPTGKVSLTDTHTHRGPPTSTFLRKEAGLLLGQTWN